MFYNVYVSEYCSESIQTLKYEMTLVDFMELKEFVDSLTAVDDGVKADHEKAKALASKKR